MSDVQLVVFLVTYGLGCFFVGMGFGMDRR